MSAKISLSSKLPGNEETNGLDSLHDSLAENPEQVICAIVWFDVPKIIHDVESGNDVVTVRVRRVEPIGAIDKVPDAIIKLNAELGEKRLGRSPLPFDVTEFENGGHVGAAGEDF